MTDDLTDTDRAAAAETQRQQSWRSKCDRVTWVMKGAHGRAFLWEILEQLGPFRSAFDPTSERLTAYQLGQKEYGLRLYQELQVICPELVQLMTREAYDRANSR